MNDLLISALTALLQKIKGKKAKGSFAVYVVLMLAGMLMSQTATRRDVQSLTVKVAVIQSKLGIVADTNTNAVFYAAH